VSEHNREASMMEGHGQKTGRSVTGTQKKLVINNDIFALLYFVWTNQQEELVTTGIRKVSLSSSGRFLIQCNVLVTYMMSDALINSNFQSLGSSNAHFKYPKELQI